MFEQRDKNMHKKLFAQHFKKVFVQSVSNQDFLKILKHEMIERVN